MMKRLIPTLLLFLLILNVSAQNGKAILQKANEAYTNGKYTEAIQDYKQILSQKMQSAELYYNLGNAYYKTADYTHAIINYERAKLLAPGDNDIQFNLKLANQHVVDAIQPLPQLFLFHWWNELTNLMTVDSWATLSIISFILLLLLAAAFFFTGRAPVKRISFWLGLLMIVISIFSFNFAARQKSRQTRHNYAIVTQPSITVKSSPSGSGTKLFLIHEGLKVQLKDSLGSWKEIQMADGNQGWLPDSAIVRI